MGKVFDELREKGKAYMQRQAYEDACRAYNDCLKPAVCKGVGNEHIGAIMSNLSLAHLRQGRYERAAKDAKECIKKRPTWEKGYFRLGEVYRHTGQYEEAHKTYVKALQMNPADTDLPKFIETAQELITLRNALRQQPLWQWAVIGGPLGLVLGLALVFLAPSPTSHDHATVAGASPLHVLAFGVVGAAVGFMAQMVGRFRDERKIKSIAEMKAEEKRDRLREKEQGFAPLQPASMPGFGFSAPPPPPPSSSSPTSPTSPSFPSFPSSPVQAAGTPAHNDSDEGSSEEGQGCGEDAKAKGKGDGRLHTVRKRSRNASKRNRDPNIKPPPFVRAPKGA